MLKTFRPKQGSVLVFSLIVLSILLSAAVAVATVSVANRRSTLSTAKSNQSFQVADSGVELVLQQIYKPVPTHANLNALATALGGGATCSGGSIVKTGVSGGDIRVSFYDKNDGLVSCTDSSWRSKVVGIKSEGTAGGTTRLVETAVAAGASSGWVRIDPGTEQNNDSSGAIERWVDYLVKEEDHRPDRMCSDAGYTYATGACRTPNLVDHRVTTGSLEAGFREYSSTLYGRTSWLICEAWPSARLANNNTEILCVK